jgi:hypothetical protein
LRYRVGLQAAVDDLPRVAPVAFHLKAVTILRSTLHVLYLLDELAKSLAVFLMRALLSISHSFALPGHLNRSILILLIVAGLLILIQQILEEDQHVLADGEAECLTTASDA